MTTESPAAPAEAAETDAPPPARGRARRVLIAIALGLVFVIAIAVLVIATRSPQRAVEDFSPDSGGPGGTRAVANVLRDQGVDVVSTTRLADVRRLAADPADTTLVLFDAYLVLGPDEHAELLRRAEHLVVLIPWDTELADLAPGVEFVGWDGNAVRPADCGLAPVVQAERIRTTAYLYDVTEADNPTTGCLAGGTPGEHAVVQTETDGTRVTLVGIPGALTNDQVLTAGNAAFALNLLGEHETLIWYLPDPTEGDQVTTITSRTPPWLTPLLALAACVGLAAAVWRGRRLGPLVPEKLPVIVKANETIDGRARLYERAGARGHALDALRVGTVARIATLCGLPRRATVVQVVDAAAALTGRPRAEVEALLVTREPAGDAEMVRLSDDLLLLESDVATATRGL